MGIQNLKTESNNAKLYAVTARGGHVGRNFFLPVTFAVKALSAKDAAAKTKNFGRVKHHHRHCIISIREITLEIFDKITTQNNADPYFKAENRQQQDLFADDIYSRVCEEEKENDYKSDDAFSRKNTYANKQKIKKPKTWNRMFTYENAEQIRSKHYLNDYEGYTSII